MTPNSVQATMKGWMPDASKAAVPASNFAIGNKGRKAAVIHITEGSAGSALSEFGRDGRQKSAHFVVGRDGHIWQCVSVIDTAFANGLSYSGGKWIDPEQNIVNPPWPGLSAPTNPNFQTISIEREGYYQDVPPAAQNAAVVRILHYLHDTFPTMLPSWIPYQTLIGHCHISPKARVNCPGPHVDFAALAALANTVSPPPTPTKYRVRVRISQRQEGGPPYAGELAAGDVVDIDKTYVNGYAHLADGRGFVPLTVLEPD